MSDEIPMKMAEIKARLGVGNSYFSAIKSRMGMTGFKGVGLLSAFTEFIAANPGFRQKDVYHRPECRCKECKAKRALPGKRRGRPRALEVAAG